MKYAPLANADPRAVLARGVEGNRTYADLLADCWGLSDALTALAPQALGVYLLCQDRYHFAAALFGIWQAGLEAWLPDAQTPLATQTAGHVVIRDRCLRPDDSERSASQPSLQLGVEDVLRQRAQSESPRGALAPVEAERILVRLRTSGTTGASKQIAKRARQLFAEAALQVEVFELRSNDCILASVPPQHIYGLLFGSLVPLVAGASLVRAAPSLTSALAEDANAFGVTVLVSVPPHLRVFAEQQRSPLPGLRQVISSGAALPPATFALLGSQLSARVSEVLGSTETGGIATRSDPREAWLALPGVEVTATSEGLLRLTSEFLEEPQQSCVVADRIELLAPGRFRYLGRDDDVVKVGGKRVSLAVIEDAARQLPGVVDAMALAVAVDKLRQTEIWLAVEAPSWSKMALRRALSQLLEPVSMPRRLRVVQRLPRLAQGKISRARVRALFAANPGGASRKIIRAVHFPRTPLPHTDPAERNFAVRVPVDSPRFEGHFPGAPLLPAVSQLHDIVLPAVRESWPDLTQPSEAPRLKFSATIAPGDDLHLNLSRSGERVRFELSKANRTCSAGALYFQR